MVSELGRPLVECHQRRPDALDLVVGQRSVICPPQRLAFHQLAQQFDDREYQGHQVSLDRVGIGVKPDSPAGRVLPVLPGWFRVRRPGRRVVARCPRLRDLRRPAGRGCPSPVPLRTEWRLREVADPGDERTQVDRDQVDVRDGQGDVPGDDHPAGQYPVEQIHQGDAFSPDRRAVAVPGRVREIRLARERAVLLCSPGGRREASATGGAVGENMRHVATT